MGKGSADLDCTGATLLLLGACESLTRRASPVQTVSETQLASSVVPRFRYLLVPGTRSQISVKGMRGIQTNKHPLA